MKNEKDNATDETTLRFAGREFPKTPEGFAQLESYGKELSGLVGRQSNEVGQARKSLAKYQRIEASLPEPIKMVLESEDASQDAKLLAQFMYNEKLQAAQKDDSSHRDQWYGRAAELVLEEMPELQDTYDVDMIDGYLKKHAIHSLEDPLGEAKRLLASKIRKPKASEAKSAQEEAGHVSVDGSSRSSRARSGTEESAKADNEVVDDSYLF